MEIKGIQGEVRPNPRPMSRRVQLPVAPVLQGGFLPKDTVGLKSSAPPRVGLAPDRLLSDLKPDELASLKGGTALESLARTQGNLTVGEARPLLSNSTALTSIAGLLESRSDLKVSDFVSRDSKGRVHIDPSYKDDSAMEFLKERQDIAPSEISAMRANLTKKLRNPKLGAMATTKALNLLKERKDIKPSEATDLMEDLGKAAGLKGGASAAKAPQAALSMFDNASKLLTKRSSLDPGRVADLAKSLGELDGGKDKNRGSRVAQGFESAVKTLENNPLREPEELTRMADTVGDHFKGKSEEDAGHRMSAFSTAAKMMEKHTYLDSQGVDKMLTKAGQAPGPKKGSKSKRLLAAMNTAEQDLSQGKITVNDLGASSQQASTKAGAKQGQHAGGEPKKS